MYNADYLSRTFDANTEDVGIVSGKTLSFRNQLLLFNTMFSRVCRRVTTLEETLYVLAIGLKLANTDLSSILINAFGNSLAMRDAISSDSTTIYDLKRMDISEQIYAATINYLNESTPMNKALLKPLIEYGIILTYSSIFRFLNYNNDVSIYDMVVTYSYEGKLRSIKTYDEIKAFLELVTEMKNTAIKSGAELEIERIEKANSFRKAQFPDYQTVTTSPATLNPNDMITLQSHSEIADSDLFVEEDDEFLEEEEEITDV